MKFRDYYEVMGVGRDAALDEIKRAYRKLARKYHPDVSKDNDAEKKFKEVGEAYAVLKDTEKRAAYDQLGQNWKSGQEFRPPPDWDEGFEFGGRGGFTNAGTDGGFGGGEQFSDFFENLFGQTGGYEHSFEQRGEDRHATISIDIRDSYLGAARGITLHAPELGEDGRVRTRDRTLNVRIPKGIRDGQKIRLTGQGAPGAGGGQAGDLFLEVEFKADENYRADGADVYLSLPVAPWEAVLGAKVTVPIPSGNVDLKIPAGSNQGSQLRLRGKGLPGKKPGDLYVVLDVRLPPADSDDAVALYQKMANELPFAPREHLEGVE